MKNHKPLWRAKFFAVLIGGPFAIAASSVQPTCAQNAPEVNAIRRGFAAKDAEIAALNAELARQKAEPLTLRKQLSSQNASSPSDLPPANALPPQLRSSVLPPTVLATQTIRGVTIRVVDAYWRRARIHTRTQGAVSFPKGLFLKFDVQTDPSLGFVLDLDQMLPHFEPMDLDTTRHALLPPGTFFSDRVDPRTDHVSFSFHENDPRPPVSKAVIGSYDRIFNIDIPLRGLRGLPPGGLWKPLAHAENGSLVGDVQSVERSSGAYAVRVWTRDTTGPKRWEFRDLGLLNQDRTPFPLTFGQVTRWPDQYFKPSGQAVQPGETGLVWQVPTDVIRQIGTKISLQVTGQLTHEDVRHFEFIHLPVPPHGETISLTADSVDPGGGHVTIRSLAWVKPWSGTTNPDSSLELQVMCDCSPWDKNRETAYHELAMTDDQGRKLSEVGGFQLDDQHYSFRLKPDPSVKFFDVRGKIIAICDDGNPRTLVFTDIPVGSPPRPIALPLPAVQQ